MFVLSFQSQPPLTMQCVVKCSLKFMCHPFAMSSEAGVPHSSLHCVWCPGFFGEGSSLTVHIPCGIELHAWCWFYQMGSESLWLWAHCLCRKANLWGSRRVMILMQTNVLRRTSRMPHALCSTGCVNNWCGFSFSTAAGSPGESWEKTDVAQDRRL